ncbi:FAD-dependent oxidoreductase [Ideonella sp. A 288]|uniref:FAD-dependent oxidoreductase n=1 Tax=Ideonella sp. A 288 TaxID=1962181 RepID=UPI0013036CFA|nr:FAD-dependent oxidoreductase [Ideonella sp. A 288]
MAQNEGVAGADAGRPIRVMIIGGGCAGMSAAWQLARQPGFEIHVFEAQAHLGGKGGSTRLPDGRVREHGLHLWFGFYENAFRMMRECYAEVQARGYGPGADDPEHRLPHACFDDAFVPEAQVGVAGLDDVGRWRLWTSEPPRTEGLPGTPLDANSNPFTLPAYVGRCLTLVRGLLLSVVGPPSEDGSTPTPRLDPRSPRASIDDIARRLRQGALVGAGVLVQALGLFEDWLRSVDFGAGVADRSAELIEVLTAQVRRQLQDLTSLDPELRWKTEVLDIVMTIAVGLYRDRVLLGRGGLDALNDIDYRDWLLRHGATRSAVVDSAFMRGIYDLAFAYRQGDRNQPAFAAGVALRSALRMFFTYRGSMFWKMGAGMGETVFSPLFRVLGGRPDEVRGPLALPSLPVRFHLAHRLWNVALGQDAERGVQVDELRFVCGAVSDPPLDHFGCWPEPPDPVFAKVNERLLRRDEDFDVVIFTAGPEALAATVGQARLEALLPAWAEMTRQVRTVATRAAQIWLPDRLPDLGWTRGPAAISALGAPLDTFADMTHVVASEAAWRQALPAEKRASLVDVGKPGALVYLCGVAADDDALESAQADLHSLFGLPPAARGPAAQGSDRANASAHRVDADDERWTDALAGIWAAAAADPSVRPVLIQMLSTAQSQPSDALARRLVRLLRARPEWAERLRQVAGAAPAPASGRWPQALWPKGFAVTGEAKGPLADAVRGADLRINGHGSERYTLSLPRTIRHRVSPLDTSVANMVLAGDWTACGLDVGCVEAAVMSGMLAAHAVGLGRPTLDEIVGFKHP